MGTEIATIAQSQITKHETSAEVFAAQAKALVNARYQIALLKPRDWDQVRQKLLRDCERPRFAAAAVYSKPVGGGKFATGLSIRFAESAIRAMTNLQPEHLVLYDDEDQRITRIALTDIEANVCYSKDVVLEKTVERRELKPGQTAFSQRINSYGKPVYLVRATEDDLLTKEAAFASKVMRQHALRLLPADIQEECEEKVRSINAAKIKADPLAEKKKIIDSFEQIGIPVTELKKFLGVESLDRLEPRQIGSLREVFQAIRDGETSWRDVMDQREQVRGTTTPASGPVPISTPVALISQDQAREFGLAWRGRLGKDDPAKEAKQKYLVEVIGVDSPLKIPADRFEEAMAWAKGSAEAGSAGKGDAKKAAPTPTPVADSPASDPPAVDPHDRQLCFEAFAILGYDDVRQAQAVKDAGGDWSALNQKLQKVLDDKEE